MRGFASLSVLAALLAAASKGQTPTPPYWHYEAVLKDGRCLSGFAPPRDIPFEATVAGGMRVKLTFTPPPTYSDPKWGWTIQWDKAGGVYVCRADGWTGELTKLWDRLEIPSAGTLGPPKVVLRGDGILEFRLRYVRAPAAGKKRR